MEIGPLSFFTQDDYSHFYNNLFSDADFDNNNKRKRCRKEDEEPEEIGKGHNCNNNNNKKKEMKDLLASMIVLDEEESREERNRIDESEHYRALFNASFDHQAQSMNTYKAQLEAHYAQSEELDQKITKKARRTVVAATASAAVAAATTSATSSVQIQPGSESGSTIQRRLWVKDRSKDWWERVSRKDFPEEEFRRWFRMSRSTFDMICDELDAAVTKKNTMLRDAIPVQQRVAVCIYRLATGDALRLVSKRFGLGISTCHKLVLEVCAAIRTVLMPKFLQWPNEEKMKRIKKKFEDISGIKNVGGAMYTTHVPIIAPKISVSAYFNKRHTERNQKTSYSITVQGVVDAKGVFSDVCIGWPGSMSDEEILEKSALFERANRGDLRDVWIVGNRGYPLMDWVLVPYTQENVTWTQHAYNEKVEEIESVGKRAFGRLKGRWGCLQKRTEVKLQDLPVVLGACCVLHNICEMRNEDMDAEWGVQIFDDHVLPENGVRSASAMQARDQIAHHLLHRPRPPSASPFL